MQVKRKDLEHIERLLIEARDLSSRRWHGTAERSLASALRAVADLLREPAPAPALDYPFPLPIGGSA